RVSERLFAFTTPQALSTSLNKFFWRNASPTLSPKNHNVKKYSAELFGNFVTIRQASNEVVSPLFAPWCAVVCFWSVKTFRQVKCSFVDPERVHVGLTVWSDANLTGIGANADEPGSVRRRQFFPQLSGAGP